MTSSGGTRGAIGNIEGGESEGEGEGEDDERLRMACLRKAWRVSQKRRQEVRRGEARW